MGVRLRVGAGGVAAAGPTAISGSLSRVGGVGVGSVMAARPAARRCCRATVGSSHGTKSGDGTKSDGAGFFPFPRVGPGWRRLLDKGREPPAPP
ncbi:MAG: hypothetical protein ACI8PZ_002940 [Myxococcota bacterium]|jgi:hypothetical protein